MTTFLLIRHGHTALVGKALAGRQAGVPLDEAGLAEAQSLVTRLSGTPVDVIYSSPLDRALQTAQPLASSRKLTVIPRARLAEIDFGTWTGKTLEELATDPLWNRFNAFRSSSRCPNGESMIDLQLRMVAELEELRAAHPDSTVALFSHGELIRATVIHYAGIPIDLCLRIEVFPASVSVLTLADWGARIVCINNTGQFRLR